MNTLFSLNGKTAWVTGGGRGLGFAIACALAEAGAKLFFNARSEQSVQNGIQAFKAHGIEAEGFVCDVTNEQSITSAAKRIAEKTGSIDILVNNAGIINRTPLTEMPIEEFQSVIATDLTAPFIVTKAVIPYMIDKKSGKIINVCGILSEVGRETAAAYASAKGGLKILTKTIACEYGKYNIQCNALAPGYMATSLNEDLRKKSEDGSQNPFDAFICANTPSGRWGSPEDLKGPAVFLASAASDYVNGLMLFVDGGFLSYLGRPV